MKHLIRWIAVVAIALLVACAQQSSGVQQQRAQGQAVYEAHCARCHGAQGEGKRGPALVGPEHGLRGYGTAQGLYDYTSRIMPFDAAGSLQPEEYWSVLAYLLDMNGALPKDTMLGPANAEQIRIDQP